MGLTGSQSLEGVCCLTKKNYHGGENHEKTIYGGRELPKKGVLGQLADLKGWGLAKKKKGSDFDVGVDTPVNTMNLTITLTVILIC